MELEYWQLLMLPLFFALGWVAARVDIHHVVRESRELPRSYFQGLNFLLSEQPDKAIDAFLEVARSDTETVELNFALGGLFRRRGETERAIRMHQSLIERDGLGEEIRLQALMELGQDYLKAGLLDRAEDIFAKLKTSSLQEEAQHQLLEIYQLEKEWQKAINVAQERDAPCSGKNIAHFHCELAANELVRSNFDAANTHLQAAQQAHRQCVRASLLLGDIALQQDKPETAIAVWQKIEQQDSAYLALVAGRMQEAYRRLGRPEEGLALLRAYLERYPSLDLLDSVYQLELEGAGQDAAYQMVRAELQRNPSLLALEKLISARLPLVAHESRADLELARTIIQGYTRRLARYRCNDCGFRARQFYWRCPACGGWETYPPRRAEEFDSSL
ncbi:lipopolysaccharide assembly protein B [Betaproteobacteria bacterium]|nr:lipopolysaccharide assembly protein B [Betaproteobacteria bacterium]GHU44076.1 lipopolysaccharide assembly protein B [Betaproteobacteria bacterium]